MPRPKTKVLVVEDTAVVRKFLVYVLGMDPDVEVIGAVANGEEALAFMERQRPDVVTMDIRMPGMDGFEVTRRIMETNPVPIVIVSGYYKPSEAAESFRAIEAGAVSIMPRPAGLGHPDADRFAREFVRTVKLMAQVKVVRRRHRAAAAGARTRSALATARLGWVIGLGASTGGPQAVQIILASLPRDLPAPILVVQHLAAGFVGGYVEWLNASSKLPVCVAVDGQILQPGHVYVAPDDYQMGVRPDGRLGLFDLPPEHASRPSVAYLFRSLAAVYGAHAIGVLLSGMGRDGADDMVRLKEAGAITMAQDKATSIVHGMPGAAIELGAACFVLAPAAIGQALAHHLSIPQEPLP